MTNLALAVAIAALLVNAFLALSMMEVVARLNAKTEEPPDRVSAGELGPGIKGAAATDLGLPVDSSRAHLVVVLSPLCASCKRIAEGFRDTGVPDEVSIVLTASHEQRLLAFVREHQLPSDRVRLDPDRALVDKPGIEGSPSALIVIDSHYDQLLHMGGPDSMASLIKQTREFNDNEGMAPPDLFQPDGAH